MLYSKPLVALNSILKAAKGNRKTCYKADYSCDRTHPTLNLYMACLHGSGS